MTRGKHRIHFKKAGIAIILLCLALLGFAMFNFVNTKAELRRLSEQADAMRQQVQTATEDNAALEYKIEHSDDPEIMEQVIREEFGDVKPRDKVFYDVNH